MTTIMKSEPTPPDREVLTGLVERVTYQNAENGFCVLRVKAPGQRELVTFVGPAGAISPGNWINDRTHGQQFKAQFLRASAPTSVEGIEKYLASGMIRGIGPVFVKGVGVLANPRSRLSLIIREPFPGHPLIRRLTRE